jgi:hypothetical protein
MRAGSQVGRRRVRVRTVVVAGVVIVALVAAGVGTANARTRYGGVWHKGHPTPPSPTASPSTSTPAVQAPTTPAATTSPAPVGYAPPPANAGVDYQIGDPYRPPAGVQVVSRDHDAAPAAGLYNICYVNGYQTQTEAADWWQSNHPDLLLRHDGKLVIDGDWNEILLDVRTAAKRAALAGIVGAWIDQCAAKGYKAVEVDNFDTYSRSQGLLTTDQALAYAKLLAAHAHAKGLAIAQKNTVELAKTARASVGFDFAVAEQCADYDECQGYTSVYGDHVIIIEYDTKHFQQACARYGSTLSIVRRDRNVTAPGSSSYKFASC